MNEELRTGSVEEATKNDIQLTGTYNILITNELALSYITSAISYIKESPKYRQRIKQETKRLETITQKFEEMMREIYGPRTGFLSDVAQFIEDECKVNIQQIETAMYEGFKNINHSRPLTMATIEIARTLCELAVVNHKYRIKEMIERGVTDTNQLNYLKMSDMLKSTTRLAELYFEGGNINLNKSLICKTALRMIERKLTDAKLIAQAIVEADKLNPAYDLDE